MVLSHPVRQRVERTSRREETPDTLTLHLRRAAYMKGTRPLTTNLWQSRVPARPPARPPLLCPRWNPHLSPLLPPPETSASFEAGGVSLDHPSEGQGSGLRTLGRATLPRSCGLHLGQVNYLMVDYALGQVRPTRKPRGENEQTAASRNESRPSARPSARLRVFINDPGRSGSAALSVALDLWALIEMGG